MVFPLKFKCHWNFLHVKQLALTLFNQLLKVTRSKNRTANTEPAAQAIRSSKEEKQTFISGLD